ncbi:transposase [Schlegelella sp. ID0723]|uniref:Transposase n=1 Tax=Piscinibacter koreensis TaxID=2742824 RepID=A0A7Y6NRN5_9BURK|nr:transposase [Schlegelella koreensis]
MGASEAEPFWTEFLRSLNRRGLRGVKLVISDSHDGIKAAASKVLKATCSAAGCTSCATPWRMQARRRMVSAASVARRAETRWSPSRIEQPSTASLRSNPTRRTPWGWRRPTGMTRRASGASRSVATEGSSACGAVRLFERACDQQDPGRCRRSGAGLCCQKRRPRRRRRQG